MSHLEIALLELYIPNCRAFGGTVWFQVMIKRAPQRGTLEHNHAIQNHPITQTKTHKHVFCTFTLHAEEAFERSHTSEKQNFRFHTTKSSQSL